MNTYQIWVSYILTVQHCRVPLKCGSSYPEDDLSRYVNQNSKSQPAPHTSSSRASYGVSFVRIWEKIDRVITALHCITVLWLKWSNRVEDREIHTQEYIHYLFMHVISKRCSVWYGAVLVHNVSFDRPQSTYPGGKIHPPSFLSSMNCTITWNSNYDANPRVSYSVDMFHNI